MMDVDGVIAKTVDVFGEAEKATGWLDDPNRLLAGATPRSLLSTPDGREQVLTVLGPIDYGVFS